MKVNKIWKLIKLKICNKTYLYQVRNILKSKRFKHTNTVCLLFLYTFRNQRMTVRKWVPSSCSWTWKIRNDRLAQAGRLPEKASTERMRDGPAFLLARFWYGRLLTNNFVSLNEFIQVDQIEHYRFEAVAPVCLN